jgi:hypothetical protein
MDLPQNLQFLMTVNWLGRKKQSDHYRLSNFLAMQVNMAIFKRNF